MKKANVTVFILLMLCVASCGPPFSNYQEFKSAGEDKQRKAISSVLESNNVVPDNKFIIQYINLMLNTSDSYQQLETQFPTSNFGEFFNKAVPVLYYSYSPENLKLAPSNIQKSAKEFIIETIPYNDYGYGYAKFQAYLRDKLDKPDENDGFIFRYKVEEGAHPNKEWGALKMVYKNNVINLFAWRSDHFAYRDFKRLSISNQSKVLRLVWWGNLVANNMITKDETGKALDIFQEEWKIDAKRHLQSRRFKNLDEDTPITTLADIALKSIRPQLDL